MLLRELMAFQYLFTGNQEEGRRLLEQVRNYVPDYAVSGDTAVEDLLNGEVDEEGIKVVFMHVDETRASILEKKAALEKVLEKYPKFRTGVFNLAVVWLQLHRENEALKVLERYHEMEKSDPTAEYYLTALYAMRLDYNKSWEHMHNLERLLHARQHHPKLLKELHKELASLSPP